MNKKIFILAVVGIISFGFSAETQAAEQITNEIESTDLSGGWARFRDKLLDREKDNDRDRRPPPRDDYGPPPPRHDYRPPPPHRPPPPPPRRPGDPPPPPRW